MYFVDSLPISELLEKGCVGAKKPNRSPAAAAAAASSCAPTSKGSEGFVKMVWSILRSCVDYFTAANDAAVKIVEGTGLRMSLARFVTGIVAMVPLNLVAGSIPKGKARHLFGACSTLSLLAFAYGRDVEQFVYAGALVYLFMRFFPKKCGYLTWGTIFSYQIYLHYERASEAAWNAGDIDFTGERRQTPTNDPSPPPGPLDLSPA